MAGVAGGGPAPSTRLSPVSDGSQSPGPGPGPGPWPRLLDTPLQLQTTYIISDGSQSPGPGPGPPPPSPGVQRRSFPWPRLLDTPCNDFIYINLALPKKKEDLN